MNTSFQANRSRNSIIKPLVIGGPLGALQAYFLYLSREAGLGLLVLLIGVSVLLIATFAQGQSLSIGHLKIPALRIEPAKNLRRLSWILIIVGLFVVFQYTQIGVMRQFQDLLSLNARAAPSANIQIEAIEEIVKRVTLGDSEIAIHVASIPLAGPGRILVLDGTALPGTSQQTRISNSELKGLVGQNQILFDGKVSDAMPAPFRFKQTNYEAQPRYYWYFLGSNYAKIRITQGGLGPEAKASATLMPLSFDSAAQGEANCELDIDEDTIEQEFTVTAKNLPASANFALRVLIEGGDTVDFPSSVTDSEGQYEAEFSCQDGSGQGDDGCSHLSPSTDVRDFRRVVILDDRDQPIMMGHFAFED